MGKKKQKRPKHVPQRTCIACRQKIDKQSLTRVVRTLTDGVVIDPTGKKNGRGAYICHQPACWDKILYTNLLNHALKTEVTETEKASLMAAKPVTHSELA